MSRADLGGWLAGQCSQISKLQGQQETLSKNIVEKNRVHLTLTTTPCLLPCQQDT